MNSKNKTTSFLKTKFSEFFHAKVHRLFNLFTLVLPLRINKYTICNKAPNSSRETRRGNLKREVEG